MGISLRWYCRGDVQIRNANKHRCKQTPVPTALNLEKGICPQGRRLLKRCQGFFLRITSKCRFKAGTDGAVAALIKSEVSSKEFRQNWARLIQKIYHVDPLLCPKCKGSMRIISFIDDTEIVKKILKHLELWEIRQRPPPRAKAPPLNIHVDYTDSQIPSYEDDLCCDPYYPVEMYAS